MYKNPQTLHRGKHPLFRAGPVGMGMCSAECTACTNYTAATQKRKYLQASWPVTRQECTRSDLRPMKLSNSLPFQQGQANLQIHSKVERWNLPFLDTLLRRRKHSSLDISVYRKPMHTIVRTLLLPVVLNSTSSLGVSTQYSFCN